jgi:hypothetical protein
VTHGDSLHPDLAPWSGEATALRRERRRLIEAGSNVRTFEDELHLIKRMAVVASLYDKRKKSGMAGRIEIVSKFARKPKRAVKVIKFWTNVPTFADEYHNRFIPSARHLIIGHTHRAGVWRRRDYTLINTGSFQPLSGTSFESTGDLFQLVASFEPPTGLGSARSLAMNALKRESRFASGRYRRLFVHLPRVASRPSIGRKPSKLNARLVGSALSYRAVSERTRPNYCF